jgi:subtilase family serine protease
MAMKRTIRQNAQPNNPVTRIHNLEFTLHGDPAFNITDRALPDLMINAQSLYQTPTEVTTEQDSFALNIIITNLGRAFTDSFVVNVVRGLPNGTNDFTADIIRTPVYYVDTMTVMIPVNLVDGLGINNICVTVDASDVIVELDENNNSACKAINIISPDIIPVYPYEFAVMPNQGITLKASTGNPFAPMTTYRLEVDTSSTAPSSSSRPSRRQVA